MSFFSKFLIAIGLKKKPKKGFYGNCTPEEKALFEWAMRHARVVIRERGFDVPEFNNRWGIRLERRNPVEIWKGKQGVLRIMANGWRRFAETFASSRIRYAYPLHRETAVHECMHALAYHQGGVLRQMSNSHDKRLFKDGGKVRI